jgi:glycerol-3-phosphate dehydrogenase (NAD(P)+)
LHAALEAVRGTAEGVATAPALHARAALLGLDLPICTAVAALIAGEMDVRQAIAALLARPRRDE